METCLSCGEPVQMMCQIGTGFCSQNCQDAATTEGQWFNRLLGGIFSGVR